MFTMFGQTGAPQTKEYLTASRHFLVCGAMACCKFC